MAVFIYIFLGYMYLSGHQIFAYLLLTSTK